MTMTNPGNAPIALNEQDKQVARMGSYIVWLEQMLTAADQRIRQLHEQIPKAETPKE